MNSSYALGPQPQHKPFQSLKLKSVQAPPGLYPPTSSLSRPHSRSAHLATNLSRPYISCRINDSANSVESPIDDIFGAFAPERYNSLPERSRPAAKALIAVALSEGVADAAHLEQNRRKCESPSKLGSSIPQKQSSPPASLFDPDPWFDDCAKLVLNEGLSFQSELNELNAIQVKPNTKLCTPFSHLPFEALAPNNVLGENIAYSCDLLHEPGMLDADATDASQRLAALVPHFRAPISLHSNVQRLNNSTDMSLRGSSRAIHSPTHTGNKTSQLNDRNQNNNNSSIENSPADDVNSASPLVFDMDQSNSSGLNDTSGLLAGPLTGSQQKPLVTLDVFLVHDDKKGTVSIDWREVLRDPVDSNDVQRVKTEIKSKEFSSQPSNVIQTPLNGKDVRFSSEIHKKNTNLSLLPQKRSKPPLKSLEGSTSPDIIILDDSDTNQGEADGAKRSTDGAKRESGESVRSEFSVESMRRQSARSRKKRVSGSIPFQKDQSISNSLAKQQRHNIITSKDTNAERGSNVKILDKVTGMDVRRQAKRLSRSDRPQNSLRTLQRSVIGETTPMSQGRMETIREKRVSFKRGPFSDGTFASVHPKVSAGKRDRRLRPKSSRQIVESSDSDDQFRQDTDDDFEMETEYSNLHSLPLTNQKGANNLNMMRGGRSAERRILSFEDQLDEPPVPPRHQADVRDKEHKIQRVEEASRKNIDPHRDFSVSGGRARPLFHRFSNLSNLAAPKNDLHKSLYDMLHSIVAGGYGTELSQTTQGHDTHNVEEVEEMLEAVGTGSPDLSESEDIEQALAKTIPVVCGVLGPCFEDTKTLSDVHEFDQTEEILQHYRDTRNEPPFTPNVASFGTHYVTETLMSPLEAWNSGRIRSTLPRNSFLGEAPENGVAMNVGQRLGEKGLPFSEVALDTTAANGSRRMHTRASLPSRNTRSLRSQTKSEALIGEDGEEVEDYGDVDSACDDCYDGSSNRSESSAENGYEEYGTLSKRARNQVKSRTIRAQGLQHRVCGHYLKCMPDEMKKRVLMWADHDFSWFEPGKDFMELKVRENEISCEQCDHDGVEEGTCEESILIKLWMDMSWRKVRRMKHRSRST